MPMRKIPMRMCMGCRERRPKRELVRVVRRASDGVVTIDPTGRLAGRADGAAVQHQPMAEVRLLLRRNDLGKLHLHLIGLLAHGQAHAVGQADAVGIRHHGGLMVDISQNEVCGLASHAGDAQQLFIIIILTVKLPP